MALPSLLLGFFAGAAKVPLLVDYLVVAGGAGSGTGDISNLADNVYSLYRLKDEEKIDHLLGVDVLTEFLARKGELL